MEKKVLYIYGYGSSPESNTATWLKENFPNSEVYSFKYDQIHPDDSIPMLCSLAHDLDIDIVIGSSLGGWYAMHVASICSLPSLIINPVTDSILKSTLELVTDNDEHIINNLVKYSKEHPLFETKEHWTGYRWDESEDGYYSVLVWSDDDEVIRSGKKLPTDLSHNFLTTYTIPNGKHQLTDVEKKNFVLPAYNKLVDEIIPKMNNFYKKTLIIP